MKKIMFLTLVMLSIGSVCFAQYTSPGTTVSPFFYENNNYQQQKGPQQQLQRRYSNGYQNRGQNSNRNYGYQNNGQSYGRRNQHYGSNGYNQENNYSEPGLGCYASDGVWYPLSYFNQNEWCYNQNDQRMHRFNEQGYEGYCHNQPCQTRFCGGNNNSQATIMIVIIQR